MIKTISKYRQITHQLNFRTVTDGNQQSCVDNSIELSIKSYFKNTVSNTILVNKKFHVF